MDPAPSLGCSLKDVKWSPVAMPLDLLVSTYRLPQIARLDSGECLRDVRVPGRVGPMAGVGEWWLGGSVLAPSRLVSPRGYHSSGALLSTTPPRPPAAVVASGEVQIRTLAVQLIRTPYIVETYR